MCIHLPCGYSSQTITKIIAYCGIAIHGFLISATALFGLILESRRDLAVLNKAYSPDVDVNVTSDGEFLFTSEESGELRTTTGGTITEEVLVDEQDDLMQFFDITDSIRSCFLLWSLLNFISGFIFSVILLQGAQERNLFKVRIWFFATVTTYLLWIPIYAYLVFHAVEPVNILVCGFMLYMLGGLSLWVVSAFTEELRIEGIQYRAGFKDVHVPFYKI